MTDPTPIHRLELTDDGLRVVSKDWMGFTTYRSTNDLVNEHPDLFTEPNPHGGLIRIGSAAHAGDTEGWFIHGANGIYAEVPFEERPLTDAEIAWCEETFMYGGSNRPETVWEFEIPTPGDLRSAILDEDLDRFDALDAVITDHEHRHRVLTELQESIEVEGFRARKLHPRKGAAIDLQPEWDPDNSHNDGKSQQHVYDMVSMRVDAHKVDFSTITGFEYSSFFKARKRVLGIRERRLEDYELLALDVAGAPDWTLCQRCGAVAPEERFLVVETRYQPDEAETTRTRRVCDDCAERIVEYGHGPEWTAEAVAKAQDERAQRLGGQRRIGGRFE